MPKYDIGNVLSSISPARKHAFILLDFHIKAGTRFSLRDERLFEINLAEITSRLFLQTKFTITISKIYKTCTTK